MKTIKFIIIAIALLAIGIGVYFWINSVTEPDKIKAAENKFTAKIEQNIEELKLKPENEFCNEFYNKIALEINEYHQQNRFSSNKQENDQWKENFEKNLYSIYVDKFIQQTFYVFNRHDWSSRDRRFIQQEKNSLSNSKYLDDQSPVDRNLKEIQSALDKYNRIVRFISSCNNFSYSGDNLSDRFPVDEVQRKIEHAQNLLANNLENRYVNNCTRLSGSLREVPKTLFDKHVSYLNNKIEYWSNMWCNYNSHRDYSQVLHTPLREEIESLGNSNIYTGVNVENECLELLEKWNNDNLEAYDAVYPCH